MTLRSWALAPTPPHHPPLGHVVTGSTRFLGRAPPNRGISHLEGVKSALQNKTRECSETTSLFQFFSKISSLRLLSSGKTFSQTGKRPSVSSHQPCLGGGRAASQVWVTPNHGGGRGEDSKPPNPADPTHTRCRVTGTGCCPVGAQPPGEAELLPGVPGGDGSRSRASPVAAGSGPSPGRGPLEGNSAMSQADSGREPAPRGALRAGGGSQGCAGAARASAETREGLFLS